MNAIPLNDTVKWFIATSQPLRIGGGHVESGRGLEVINPSTYGREMGGDAIALYSQTKSVWIA